MANKIKKIASKYNNKYDISACAIIEKIAAGGGFRAHMCISLNITEKTFNTWREKYEEFDEAAEKADLISLAFYETKLKDYATGVEEPPRGAIQALFKILDNKHRKYYMSSPTNVTINQLAVLPSDAIMNKINELQKLYVTLPDNKTLEQTNDYE